MRKLPLLTVAMLMNAAVLAQDAAHDPITVDKLGLDHAAKVVSANPAANDTSAADKLGWQLSIHAYTFRKFSIFQCIDKTAALGLKYMSLSGSVSLDGTNSLTTVKLSDQDAAAIREAAAAKGIKLVNIGVVTLP